MIIQNCEDAFELFKNILVADVEEIWIAALNSQKKVLKIEMLFRGTVNECLAHPRDVFRFVVKHNAAGFILAHNHPSGDPTPSTQDLKWTYILSRLSDWHEIPLFDHLVLAGNIYRSMAMEYSWVLEKDQRDFLFAPEGFTTAGFTLEGFRL